MAEPNLWNIDLCAGLYRTYRSLSDESIAGPPAILQITAPAISHNTTVPYEQAVQRSELEFPCDIHYPPVKSHQQSNNLNRLLHYSRANGQLAKPSMLAV